MVVVVVLKGVLRTHRKKINVHIFLNYKVEYVVTYIMYIY